MTLSVAAVRVAPNALSLVWTDSALWGNNGAAPTANDNVMIAADGAPLTIAFAVSPTALSMQSLTIASSDASAPVSVTIKNPIIVTDPIVVVGSSTLTLNEGADVSGGGTISVQSGGAIQANGPVAVSNPIIIDPLSSLGVGPGGVMTVSSTATFSASDSSAATAVLDGTIMFSPGATAVFNAGTTITASNPSASVGTVVVSPNAQLNFVVDPLMPITVTASFTNNGNMLIAGSGPLGPPISSGAPVATVTFDASCPHYNSSIIHTGKNGSLTVAPWAHLNSKCPLTFSGGKLSGFGNVTVASEANCTVHNSSIFHTGKNGSLTVAPWAHFNSKCLLGGIILQGPDPVIVQGGDDETAGTLTLNADVVMWGPSAITQVLVDASGVASQIAVSGTAFVAGSAVVNANIDPLPGITYPIVTANALSGSFSNVDDSMAGGAPTIVTGTTATASSGDQPALLLSYPSNDNTGTGTGAGPGPSPSTITSPSPTTSTSTSPNNNYNVNENDAVALASMAALIALVMVITL